MQTFFCRTTVYTGNDALDALKQFAVKRVLIITDRFLSESSLLSELKLRLPNADIEVFDCVVPDPPLSLAAEGAAICRMFHPELIVAFGGGSPMDCAKAIYMAAELSIPFVAIPTTSGSGSEMTAFSILTHEGVKYPLVDEVLRPTAAILDPRFLSDLPPSLIADTGMDLITHCMEALVSKTRTPFSSALAVYALQCALHDLAKSFSGDKSGRGRLHEAASMAGLAFDQSGLGVCHALAHAMGGILHIPHGRLCAMLLPPVMRYNEQEAMSQYVLAAKMCGISGVTDKLVFRDLISRLEQLRKKLGLPDNLKQAGISTEQWNACKQSVLESAIADGCCKTNPVPVTMQGLEEICKAVAP